MVSEAERQQEGLRNWVKAQMEARGWRQQDVLNASKNCPHGRISSASLSNFLNGKSTIGTEIARRFAWVFNVTDEEVFRMAGLMSDSPDTGKLSPQAMTILQMIRSLPPQNQSEVAKALRAIIEVIRIRNKSEGQE